MARKGDLDPASLLTRGYVARFLPPTLKSLTQEEIDKDLRHFNAYRSAVISYRQQYYLAVNHHNLPQEPQPLATLPVKIDPEEEKRLTLLRKKIARAEFHREEAEQQYVALRAHYVQTSQELDQASKTSAAVLEFLQEAVQNRSTAVGLLRARLQMARDVLAALQRRGDALAQAAADGGAASAPVSLTGVNELEDLWNQVEDELKKVRTTKKKKPMLWPCIQNPSTPRGVPILLSALSLVPEKSIAFGTNGTFGAKPHSMCYLADHLPVDAEEFEEDTEEVDTLREECDFLQTELDKERLLNEQVAGDIAASRHKHDELVSMICLVRQETEAVLFRHNIILESDHAQEVAKELYDKSMQDRVEAAATLADAAETVAQEEDAAGEAAPKPARPADEANDGDDEESNDEESMNGKRAAEEGDTGNSRKRARR